MKKCLWLLCICPLAATSASFEEVADLVIIFGQSNAGSPGAVEHRSEQTVAQLGIELAEFKRPRADVFIFTQGQEYREGGGNGWQALLPGVNTQSLTRRGKPRNSFGVETRVGDGLAAAEGRPIYIIKSITGGAASVLKLSTGGTRLRKEDRKKPDWNPESRGELFDQFQALVAAAVADIKATGREPLCRALIWIQGEADARGGTPARVYQTAEAAIAAQMRALLNDPGCPFIAPLLRAEAPQKVPVAAAKSLNDAKRANASVVAHYHTIDVVGLSFKDGIHYDTRSVLALSDRIVERIVSLPRRAGD